MIVDGLKDCALYGDEAVRRLKLLLALVLLEKSSRKKWALDAIPLLIVSPRLLCHKTLATALQTYPIRALTRDKKARATAVVKNGRGEAPRHAQSDSALHPAFEAGFGIQRSGRLRAFNSAAGRDKMEPISGAVVLSTALYVVFSAAETVLVKTLNYKAGIVLPMFTALLVNLQWIYQIPQLILQRRPRTAQEEEAGKVHPSRTKRLLVYLGTGLLTFAITLGRNIAVNVLSGSFFVLLISTSIVFNIFLSWLCLRRRVNRFHLIAGVLCICAAGVGGLASREDKGEEGKAINWALGVPSAIAAAFFIASMSVSADRIVSAWPSKDLRITEMTIVASLVAGALLVPLVFLTGEDEKWRSDLPRAFAASVKTRSVLITVAVLLPLAKALIRSAKYSTISHTSALFFEFVQASASLFSSLANVLLFPDHEPFSFVFLGSLALLASAFAVYARGRMLEKKDKEELAEEVKLVPDALVFPDPAEKEGAKREALHGVSSLPFSPKTSAAVAVERSIRDGDGEGNDAEDEERHERERASAILPPRPSSTAKWARGFVPFLRATPVGTGATAGSVAPVSSPPPAVIELVANSEGLFAIDSVTTAPDSLSLSDEDNQRRDLLLKGVKKSSDGGAAASGAAFPIGRGDGEERTVAPMML